MSAIIPRPAVTRSAEIALFFVVSLLPLAVSAAAVIYIAYVHDGVVVSGWMPQDRREGYTELSTWVWILTPWLAVALTLLVAIWSRRFSNGSAILISIVLFVEWMYIFAIFFAPQDLCRASLRLEGPILAPRSVSGEI